MIDNIVQISKLLQFDSTDDFYHLQIIKRKKENKELGSNSRVIKTYYIFSLEYLNERYEEMKLLAQHNNARVCINLNRRSYEKIAYHTMRKVCDQIMNKDFKSVRKAYESVCGSYGNEPNKKWIVDIDCDKSEEDLKEIEMMKNTIINCEPDRRQNKIYAQLETKNGYHLITSPFNVIEFRNFYPVDIHKDNPTILFIP